MSEFDSVIFFLYRMYLKTGKFKYMMLMDDILRPRMYMEQKKHDQN